MLWSTFALLTTLEEAANTLTPSTAPHHGSRWCAIRFPHTPSASVWPLPIGTYGMGAAVGLLTSPNTQRAASTV